METIVPTKAMKMISLAASKLIIFRLVYKALLFMYNDVRCKSILGADPEPNKQIPRPTNTNIINRHQLLELEGKETIVHHISERQYVYISHQIRFMFDRFQPRQYHPHI